MEWLGVVMMLLVAMLAAAACDGIVRLLYILAPAKASSDTAQRRYSAGG